MSKTNKTCPVCGTSFQPRNNKHIACSSECAYARLRKYQKEWKRKQAMGIPKVCPSCNKEHDRHRAKYCSIHCRKVADLKNRGQKYLNRKCQRCQAVIKDYAISSVYCEKHVHSDFSQPKPTLLPCVICGNKEKGPTSQTCSRVCYKELRKRQADFSKKMTERRKETTYVIAHSVKEFCTRCEKQYPGDHHSRYDTDGVIVCHSCYLETTPEGKTIRLDYENRTKFNNTNNVIQKYNWDYD